MYVLTREASKYIDEYVPVHWNMPLELLMENAGRGLADAIYREELDRLVSTSIDGIVLFVCGTGNNGADGLVAARHLTEMGISVAVALAGDVHKGSELFSKQLSIVKSLGIDICDFGAFNDWSRVTVVVEGLVGTGFKGSMKEPLQDVLHRIDVERTQYGSSLWAIDVPAGTDATTGQITPHTLSCDVTVTFGSIKEGLLLYPGKTAAGNVIVATLGIPWDKALVEAPFNTNHYTIDEDLVSNIIHYRHPQSHKGINGSFLCIGGSPTMIGAPILSAEAAVRSGTGKVSLAVPSCVQSTVQCTVIPEVMVQGFEDSTSIDLHGYDVVAIGPGLGRSSDRQSFVESIIDTNDTHIIVDADGLYALGTIGTVHKEENGLLQYEAHRTFSPMIMTPHLGEFGRLIGKSTSFIEKHYVELATQFSRAHNVIVVLKGIPSLDALPNGYVYINTLGNEGMGTGGMGDTLTGIIAAFVAQGYSLGESALLGVYLHSRSADLVSEDKPWGYTPSDVSLTIGSVIKELLEG